MSAAIQSATATEGRSSRTSAPHAAPVHAYASDGQIIVMDGGRYQPMTRWGAIAVLIEVDGSPFPSSQERARQIRAALKETVQ